jgi:ribosome-associated protein
MPDDLRICPSLTIPADLLHFTFARSSGPGGQNVNKLATRAQLRVPLAALATLVSPTPRPPVPASSETPAFRRSAEARDRSLPPSSFAHRLAQFAGSHLTPSGDILITADESRSQRQNRQACLDRLHELLLRALHKPRPRRPTRPSKGSRQRRLSAKRLRGQAKQARRVPRIAD